MTPNTLRKWEDPSGEFVTVYGHQIRVYRIGPSRRSQRRYNETEIFRVLARLAKEKAPQKGGAGDGGE